MYVMSQAVSVAPFRVALSARGYGATNSRAKHSVTPAKTGCMRRAFRWTLPHFVAWHVTSLDLLQELERDPHVRANANLDDFAAMNEVYGAAFEAPYPARFTVQVARLPRDARIEIGLIAVTRR